MAGPRLVGDIGGTNARFALARDGAFGPMTSHPGNDFASLEDAIEAYLGSLGTDDRPTEAAFSIAGPVTGDRVTLTNHPWSFSQAELARRFKFEPLRVFNDFAANALSLPYLADGDRTAIGRGEAADGAPFGILGPGTGLGVSGLVRAASGDWTPLAGEGGHVTLPAGDEREAAVIAVLRRRFDHVSAERALSGDGLVNLYQALCEIDGAPAKDFKAAQITDETVGSEDRHCGEAVAMFCAMLGGVAGNLALTLGARAGVFIAGGIVPRLGDRFARSAFRTRFEAKGRFADYLARIPTYLITHKNPAMLGLARLP